MDRILNLKSWHDDWNGIKVAVLGSGVSGFSAADTLQELGAEVLVISDEVSEENKKIYDVLGVSFSETEASQQLGTLKSFGADLVFASSGYRPDNPLIVWAEETNKPVWGEIELAWRLRDKVGKPADWIVITGTNGKTTTASLTAHMLVAGGHRAAPVGNIGTPILDAIRDPEGFDVLVVELSSFQLHRLGEISPHASVCLNVAEDHIDWHGSYEAYLEAKSKIYEDTIVACVYNRNDSATLKMVENADVIEGARAVSFGLDTPHVSGLGLVEGILVDRGFHETRKTTALELTSVDELRANGLDSPHLVEDVLAAAALARSYGVSPEDIANALAGFKLDSHRVELVAECDGLKFVNDSKATNTHAADASLKSFKNIVWIVGGVLKGQSLDELVEKHKNRLRGVVVIGDDREEILAALSRHAKDIPTLTVDNGHTEGVMFSAVKGAKSLAQPGDVVLLSPAAASMDQFKNFEDRGNQFKLAVSEICGGGDKTDGQPDILRQEK